MPAKKKRIKKLELPKDLTIVSKKWKKKHKNPVVALQMSKGRSQYQRQLWLSRFKSWTQESYQFLQIEDKKPEKIEMDLESEQKKPEKIEIDLVSDSDEEPKNLGDPIPEISEASVALSMYALVDLGDGTYLVRGEVVSHLTRSMWS